MKPQGWIGGRDCGGTKVVFLAVFILAGTGAALNLVWDTSVASLFPPGFSSTDDLMRLQRSEGQAPIQVVVPTTTEEAALQSLQESLREEGFTLLPPGKDFATLAYSLHLAGQAPEAYRNVLDRLRPERRTERLSETRARLGGLLDPAGLALLRFDPLRLAGDKPVPLISGTEAMLPPVTFEVVTGGDPEATYDQLRQVLGDAFGLTGPGAFAVEISRAMERDMRRMLPVLMIVILLLFFICFRKLRPLGLLLATQGVALAAALIAAALCYGSLNAISLGFAAILLGIGVDYAILMACAGRERALTGRGVLLSAITTGGGFAWLGLSHFPGVAQVGVMVAVGVVVAAVASIWLAPHFSVGEITGAGRFSLPDPGRAGPVALAVLTAGSLLLCVRVGWPVDPAAERLAPTHLPAWKAQEQMLPESLEASMAQMAGDYSQLAVHLRRNQALAFTRPEVAELRNDLDAAGFGSGWGKSLPDVLDTLEFFHEGSPEMANLLGAWTAWPRLGREAAAEAGREWPLLFIFSIGSVLIILGLGLRQWRAVWVCFFLAASCLVVMGGVFSLTGFRMSLISMLCLPVIPALAVDYSIHLHLGGRSQGSRRALWRYVGLPICLSALTSLAGFLALATSSQPVLSNLGITLSSGIAAAFLVNFLGLPLLLSRPRSALTPVHSERLYRDDMFESFSRICGMLPRCFLHRLAFFCGYLYGWTHPERTGIVQRNLKLIDPRFNSCHRACRTYGNFAIGLSDYFRIASCTDRDVSNWISAREGKDHLLRAHQAGRGAIILSMHHGFFEFGGWIMKELNIPFTIVTNPEPSDALTRWRADYRKRWGAETIVLSHDGFSHLELAEPIRQGRMVALLFDRPDPARPVPVSLPGGTAYFAGTFLHVARSLGCPVLPGPVLTEPDGTYRFKILDPIHIERRGSREEMVRYYMQKITDAFLPYLCQYPELWYQFVPLWEPPSRPDSYPPPA